MDTAATSPVGNAPPLRDEDGPRRGLSQMEASRWYRARTLCGALPLEEAVRTRGDSLGTATGRRTAAPPYCVAVARESPCK
jgi:hypothetical protein